MNNKLLNISFLSCFTFLTSCQQEVTYEYLMTHPKVLQKQIADCDNTPDLPKCNIILRAGNDFGRLLQEQSNDPDSFGERMIREQQELVMLANAYEKAKLANDPEKTKAAEVAYQNQVKIVDIYQAVLSTRSPD